MNWLWELSPYNNQMNYTQMGLFNWSLDFKAILTKILITLSNFLLNSLSFLAYWSLLKSFLFLLFSKLLSSFEMESHARKIFGLLTYLGSSSLLFVPSKESCPLCPVVKDPLREIADKLSLGASIPFESTDEEDHHQYVTLFDKEEWKNPDKSLVCLERDWERGVSWFDSRFES